MDLIFNFTFTELNIDQYIYFNNSTRDLIICQHLIDNNIQFVCNVCYCYTKIIDFFARQQKNIKYEVTNLQPCFMLHKNLPIRNSLKKVNSFKCV